MPSTTARVLGKGASKIPGLKRLPLLKVLAIGEIAILVREHASLLEPADQRRLLELVRKGRGRPANLRTREREELAALVAKAEPRRFAILAADKLSPIRLPRSITRSAYEARRDAEAEARRR
ncbi:MAG: hypothetical protein QOF76_3183 [Solirubrobacteraceae bacterium]|jgi:hypothetical protein|nr:hypothetical protein [Solirubrobacteraceae bacterium]